METDDQNMDNQHAGALSIYGQTDAAMDDFPVLKAFQQYIDAEQSKSRKRMILLCMFFGVLMTILVSVFLLVLSQSNRDKQQVNDQLIQFLMKERERMPSVVQPVQPAGNPATDAALKSLTETLANLQRDVAEQKKVAEDDAAATRAEIEIQRKTERENARLRRAQEELAAEKRRLAEEKERLRLEEVERQRRRLYPDYYRKLEQPPSQSVTPAVSSTASETNPKRPPRKAVVYTDEDIDDILREVDEMKEADERKAKAKAKAQKKPKSDAKKKSSKEADDSDTKEDRPTEYFTDTEYALPVKVNGEDAGWSVPLD